VLVKIILIKLFIFFEISDEIHWLQKVGKFADKYPCLPKSVTVAAKITQEHIEDAPSNLILIKKK